MFIVGCMKVRIGFRSCIEVGMLTWWYHKPVFLYKWSMWVKKEKLTSMFSFISCRLYFNSFLAMENEIGFPSLRGSLGLLFQQENLRILSLVGTETSGEVCSCSSYPFIYSCGSALILSFLALPFLLSWKLLLRDNFIKIRCSLHTKSG